MRLEGPRNPDCTLYDPPMLPEYKELLKTIPPCSFGMSYSCMFCHKCPYGDYFKWPAGTEAVREAQAKAEQAYMESHGASSILDLYFDVTEEEKT